MKGESSFSKSFTIFQSPFEHFESLNFICFDETVATRSFLCKRLHTLCFPQNLYLRLRDTSTYKLILLKNIPKKKKTLSMKSAINRTIALCGRFVRLCHVSNMP